MKQLFNKHNSFLIALVSMVVLARIVPYRKEYNEIFDLSTFIDWGICIIFLLYGLKLNIKQVLGDIKNWRLHLLVQLGTFVLFPLLVLPFYLVVKGTNYELIWLSVFFLASLPSTISSSVVPGIHCQGQCYRCYIQCLCFGTYRYRCHAIADGFLHRRHADGRRARRGSAATAAQSATAAHTRAVAKSFVEKNSGQIHTSDRAFRPTYNIAYRLRELLRRFRPPNILVGIANGFRCCYRCGCVPVFRCLHHTPAYHQAIAFLTRRYHRYNVLRV